MSRTGRARAFTNAGRRASARQHVVKRATMWDLPALKTMIFFGTGFGSASAKGKMGHGVPIVSLMHAMARNHVVVLTAEPYTSKRCPVCWHSCTEMKSPKLSRIVPEREVPSPVPEGGWKWRWWEAKWDTKRGKWYVIKSIHGSIHCEDTHGCGRTYSRDVAAALNIGTAGVAWAVNGERPVRFTATKKGDGRGGGEAGEAAAAEV